jgi:hypothetical protein
MSNVVSILIAVGLGLPVISLAFEALHPIPSTPTQLRWASDIPTHYAEVNGLKLRRGKGVRLLLIHVLFDRTVINRVYPLFFDPNVSRVPATQLLNTS